MLLVFCEGQFCRFQFRNVNCDFGCMGGLFVFILACYFVCIIDLMVMFCGILNVIVKLEVIRGVGLDVKVFLQVGYIFWVEVFYLVFIVVCKGFCGMAKVFKYQCIIGNFLVGNILFLYFDLGIFNCKVQFFLVLFEFQFGLFVLINIYNEFSIVFFFIKFVKFFMSKNLFVIVVFCVDMKFFFKIDVFFNVF